MKRFALAGNRHGNVVALFLDADSSRRGNVGLNLARRTAARFAVLKRREALAVDDGVGIGRVRIQTLTDEQARLAMRLAAGAHPADVRCERDVARRLFPDEVKRVAGEPHVLPASGNEVTLPRGIVFNRTGLAYGANVTVRLEQSER